MKQRIPQTWLEWGFVALLAVLCAMLSVLQYRWTGELSRAETVRLRANLQDRIEILSRNFNTELSESVWDLVPTAEELREKGREAAHMERYKQWIAKDGHHPLFSRIAVAAPEGDGIKLTLLDPKQLSFQASAWPAEWDWMRLRLHALSSRQGPFRSIDPSSLSIEIPIFTSDERGPPRRPGQLRELEWLIVEVDRDYLRRTLLPELVKTHLNSGPEERFDVEVRGPSGPGSLIYASDPDGSGMRSADASTDLFAIRRFRPGRRGRGGPENERGRLTLAARHRSGSLEAVVAKARTRNLAMALLLLSLIVIAGSALVRYTRRTRRIAEMQIDFVAGVSHELRTPLAVIRAAGHNLLSGVVKDGKQAERYSRLIVQHADQLTEMIEQVLSFASLRPGRQAIQHQPLSIKDILDGSVEAASGDLQASGCAVDLQIPATLPEVTGDLASLRRAFQNLIANAAKHGSAGGRIGIRATAVEQSNKTLIEVRVADNGPGIPGSEIAHLFEPFYRGERARTEQIRGTGLGLSLLKSILDAHGGSVEVQSVEGRGTEFLVRLPAAEKGSTHELAHFAG